MNTKQEDKVLTAEDYLKNNGMAGVGHYGLLITDPSKSKMHQIMEDYAEIYANSQVQEERERIRKEIEALLEEIEEEDGTIIAVIEVNDIYKILSPTSKPIT